MNWTTELLRKLFDTRSIVNIPTKNKINSLLLSVLNVPNLRDTSAVMYFVRSLITCSRHQKNETTNSPIHQFKVLQNVF